MKLTGKKILVTGGAGFIGSHLVESLVEKSHDVRVMVHYNSMGRWGHLDRFGGDLLDGVEIFPGDVSDPFSVLNAVDGCDVVFHLAALIAIPYSYVAPRSYVATNIDGTLNVLEACRRLNVERLVHTSTSETYGTARYTPIDEKHPMQGQSPYSASKIAADKLAESYYRSFELPVATLRPFNTFGPRQSARAVIPTIITQALSGDIVKLGSLTPVRDLTFVKDTVAAFIAVAECDDAVGTVINSGNGNGITIGDLAARILGLMGKSVRCRLETDDRRIRPKKSEVFELVCDNSKALDMTGWTPTYSLDQGIEATIRYLEANLEEYRTELYNI